MPVSRPYYSLHQILTGQYTTGNEYVLSDGLDYIGMYHILPNEQVFTEAQPNLSSQELFVKRNDQTKEVEEYNRITSSRISQYRSPIPIQRQIESDEYMEGMIQRYFVQKRNNPVRTIMEIDGNQYNSINTSNKEGINGLLYNSIAIDWRISKIPSQDAAELNRRALVGAERKFKGIGQFLSNTLEFYK